MHIEIHNFTTIVTDANYGREGVTNNNGDLGDCGVKTDAPNAARTYLYLSVNVRGPDKNPASSRTTDINSFHNKKAFFSRLHINVGATDVSVITSELR